jgi:hypothetical protein
MPRRIPGSKLAERIGCESLRERNADFPDGGDGTGDSDADMEGELGPCANCSYDDTAALRPVVPYAVEEQG